MALAGLRAPEAHRYPGAGRGAGGVESGHVVFTGTVTLNSGAFRDVTRVGHESDDSVHVHGKTLTFRFTNFGKVRRDTASGKRLRVPVTLVDVRATGAPGSG